MSEEDSVEEEHNGVREGDGDQDSVPEEESGRESDNPCHDEHPETVTRARVIGKKNSETSHQVNL